MQAILQHPDVGGARPSTAAPTSWNHGSFHANNPIYTAPSAKKFDQPALSYGQARTAQDTGSMMRALPRKSPGVFPEDLFRCMKENKAISANYQKTFKKKHDMALSRFESDINMASQMPGGAANNLVAGNPGLGPLAKRLMMSPDIDEKEALSLIQLPAETMYLIDKVVRQKARAGPIGVDNSEVINLEFENEFKSKHKHIFKLNDGTLQSAVAEDLADGYVDEQGVYHGIDQDQKLFQQNEKLLQRLTNAVYRDSKGRPNADFADAEENVGDNTAHTDIINISSANQEDTSGVTNAQVKELINQQVNGQEGNYMQLGAPGTGALGSTRGGPSQPAQILALEAKAKKKSHAEWVRRKQHEMELRAKLIVEAKRDLLETLVQKQEEEAIRMQERTHQMSEWERRKRMHLQHHRLLKLQKDESERLEKKHRQEISYMKFKDWLKKSLIKQREEQVQKKMAKQEKKAKEDEEQRTKANRRVMARIAYKDWKQTKLEEEKLRKKREQIQRRQGLFDSRAYGRAGAGKPGRTFSARGGLRSENSSRYINTEHKRNQISTRGGQANMLAYSLNKNMKNLRMEEGNALMRKSRPRSAYQGRAPVAKRNKRAANKNYGQGQAQRPPQAQAPHLNQQNGYYYGQAPGAAQNIGHQDMAYVPANLGGLQPGQTYGSQMPQYDAMGQHDYQRNIQSEHYYQQQQQQQREDLMQEAEDAGQMDGSRPQLQPHGSDGTEGLPVHHQELGPGMGHDQSPGGADGEDDQEDLEQEKSLQQSEAQMQHQLAMDDDDDDDMQEALALAADMNGEVDEDGLPLDKQLDDDEDEDDMMLNPQQEGAQDEDDDQDGSGDAVDDAMYQQMMANQMDQVVGEEEEEEGEVDEDMMYADDEFDAARIIAQIGLTPEQLQNLTEADLAQLTEAQIQGIARLQMHQMHQERQMQGDDDDMGEEMAGAGEDDGDHGLMTYDQALAQGATPEDLGLTEAEYLRVLEQQRLEQEDEDDEEGLTEEQIEQLRDAFDRCDGDKDGALSKAELEALLVGIGAQLNDDAVDKLVQIADANQDGRIHFEEFVTALAGIL